MSLVAVASSAMPHRHQPLRVMLVDDSVVIRGLISRWIGAEADLEVVASVRTGRDAVNQVLRADPDVVVLDIEMPDLDGISALPLLLEKKRDLVVIMASTLTRRNAEVSLKALSLGAADYIPKPESTRELNAAETFRRDLLDKIRHLGLRARRRAAGLPSAAATARTIPSVHDPRTATPVRLRPWSLTVPRVLVIGSSTGGPQALMELTRALGPDMANFPVLITQHMPPTFTTILAEHLGRVSQRPSHEAIDGEPVRPGQIYLAPGGRHLRVVRHQGVPTIALGDDDPINFCRPSVDPLFASAAAVWQSATLAVVLTGMGTDGARGGADVTAAGGSVIAQDEATSVVWGMPGATAHAGICAAVLPLADIAPKVTRLFAGDRQ